MVGPDGPACSLEWFAEMIVFYDVECSCLLHATVCNMQSMRIAQGKYNRLLHCADDGLYIQQSTVGTFAWLYLSVSLSRCSYSKNKVETALFAFVPAGVKAPRAKPQANSNAHCRSSFDANVPAWAGAVW